MGEDLIRIEAVDFVACMNGKACFHLTYGWVVDPYKKRDRSQSPS